MNTKLYSDLVRRKVQVPNDRKNAKIVDVIVHKEKGRWKADEVMVESGWIDKDALFLPTGSLTDPKEEGDIRIKEHVKASKSPKTGDMFLSRLKKSRVISTDDEELGRAYDFEIFVGDKTWIVWKILVNPVGLDPNKRRLRIPIKNIKKMDSKNIWVEPDHDNDQDEKGD